MWLGLEDLLQKSERVETRLFGVDCVVTGRRWGWGGQSELRKMVVTEGEHLLRSRSGILATLNGVTLYAGTTRVTSITPQLETLTLDDDQKWRTSRECMQTDLCAYDCYTRAYMARNAWH